MSIFNTNEPSKLFCLEGVQDIEDTTNSTILPSLESLAMQQNITSIYKTCDSIEGLEESLSALLYEDRNFRDYEILYLVFEGRGNVITIGGYDYSLEEIAEFFEGKLRDKIVHFANTKILDLTAEAAQYFLDVSGARAVSGYRNSAPVLSTILDNQFFGLCQEFEDVIEITEELYRQNYALAKTLGFTLYY